MRSLDQVDVQGKRVLVRVDFNVPLLTDEDGEPAVADDTRIVAALPTLQELRERGASLVLVSHLGRPDCQDDEGLSLAPVAERLRELTGANVTLAPAVIGDEVKALVESMAAGEIVLLENVRFEPGETSQTGHLRKHSLNWHTCMSTTRSARRTAHMQAPRGWPTCCQRRREAAGAGGSDAHFDPREPSTPACSRHLGGAKVEDKIGTIERFLQLADAVMIGGAMCFPFFAAQGHEVGDSLCGEEDIEHAGPCKRETPSALRSILPVDLVVAKQMTADADVPSAGRRASTRRFARSWISGRAPRATTQPAIYDGATYLLEWADGRL